LISEFFWDVFPMFQQEIHQCQMARQSPVENDSFVRSGTNSER
jgi:hypothetical protein